MKATFTSAVAKELRDYECPSCGHRAKAMVTAIGEGAQSSLNARGTAEERARENAAAALDHVFALAQCPKCGHQDAAARWKWFIRRTVPLVLVVALVAGLGWAPMIFDLDMKESDKPIAGWVMTGIALVVAIPFVFTHIVMGWHSAKAGVKFDR